MADHLEPACEGLSPRCVPARLLRPTVPLHTHSPSEAIHHRCASVIPPPEAPVFGDVKSCGHLVALSGIAWPAKRYEVGLIVRAAFGRRCFMVNSQIKRTITFLAAIIVALKYFPSTLRGKVGSPLLLRLIILPS